MSIKFSVLLYSKYSKFSTEIVSQVNQYQNVFLENFNMKLLCIDNELVRKRIISSKKINISFVPSILVIYEDGGVEKYENNDAFVWVNEVIQRVLTITKQQQAIEQENTAQEENSEIEEEEEEIKPKKVVQKTQKQKQKQIQQKTPLKKKNVPKNKTSIEDLEDLDDLEQDEYDEENNQFEHQMIEQVESTNAMTAKKNDLLSLAAEMQKSRDSFEKTNEKPRF